MIDELNDRLIVDGERPIAFDNDCREGICGACSMTINGRPHGPGAGTTTCQIYMRQFEDGATLTVEPFNARPFRVIRDLIVDRGPLDRIIQAGGYTGVNAGPKPEPNANPVSPEDAEQAIDAAICIGCGACVAACPNGAAMLFTGAKISHLGHLPQGQPSRYTRVQDMVEQMDVRGIRWLHELRRVRGGVPEGDLDPRDRAAESRLPDRRAVPSAQSARPDEDPVAAREGRH